MRMKSMWVVTSSLLEPLLMVFLGVIGGVVIAMYLPIFQMANSVG
jgi:type IV pilus assembly protein PilC